MLDGEGVVLKSGASVLKLGVVPDVGGETGITMAEDADDGETTGAQYPYLG